MSTLTLTYSAAGSGGAFAAKTTLNADQLDQNFKELRDYLHGRNGGLDGSNLQSGAKLTPAALAEPRSTWFETLTVLPAFAGVGLDGTKGLSYKHVIVPVACEIRSARVNVQKTVAANAGAVDLFVRGVFGKQLIKIGYADNVADSWGYQSPPLPHGTVELAARDEIVMELKNFTNIDMVVAQLEFTALHTDR